LVLAQAHPRHMASGPIGGAPCWDRIQFDVRCPTCAYNLRGLLDPRCPECGKSFDWRGLIAEASTAERMRQTQLTLRADAPRLLASSVRTALLRNAVCERESRGPHQLLLFLGAGAMLPIILFELSLICAWSVIRALRLAEDWGHNVDHQYELEVLSSKVLATVRVPLRALSVHSSTFLCPLIILLAWCVTGGVLALRSPKCSVGRKRALMESLRVVALTSWPAGVWCGIGAAIFLLGLAIGETFELQLGFGLWATAAMLGVAVVARFFFVSLKHSFAKNASRMDVVTKSALCAVTFLFSVAGGTAVLTALWQEFFE
jgi:hypothetical protein